jgi:Tfp pilus assembly protein PilO
VNSRRQITVGAAIAVAVTVLFFFVLLKPKLSDISKTRDDIEAAQAEQQSLQTRLKHLQDVQKRAPQIEAKIARISQYLPATPDLPGFIRLVQTAATGSGIDLQSIAPSPPTPLENSTGVSTISVTLTAQGGFFRMEDFLSRLEDLKRAVEVRSLAMAPVQTQLSSEVSLNSTITLQMYVATEAARASGSSSTSSRTSSPSPSPSAGASP